MHTFISKWLNPDFECGFDVYWQFLKGVVRSVQLQQGYSTRQYLECVASEMVQTLSSSLLVYFCGLLWYTNGALFYTFHRILVHPNH